MNLPESKEAEEAVLGCCLIDPPAIDDVAQIIRDERAWFYPSHLDLWRILKSFRERNKSIDGMLIHEEIKKAGKLETFGGEAWLGQLVNRVAHVGRVKDYCGIVWDHWIRRLAIADASRTMQSAGETEAKAGNVVAMVTRQAQELSEAAAPPNRETKESLIDAVVADWMDPPPGWAGVPSGLFAIDNVIGGFRKGELIIVGARPSCGKSAITLGFALHAALIENLNVLFLTLEMTPKESMARAIAMVSGVPMNANNSAKNGSPQATEAVIRAANAIKQSRLTILGGHAYDAEMCCAVIRREHARKPLDLVVVDHLHHMKHREAFKGEGGVEAIGHSTEAFKNTALGLDIPVILPAQLNRGPADRADQRPMMSDLRASGKIEEHADVIMLMSPNFTEEQPNSTIFQGTKRRPKQTIIDGLVQIEIAKNRNGPTDDVTVQFCAAVTKFTNQQIGGKQEWV